MDDLLPLIQPDPWSLFTAGLVAAMAFSRGMDFLSTWIVTPKLQLEANPLMRRLRWGRMALNILTKSFQEQGVPGQGAVAPWMAPAGGSDPSGLTYEAVQ